MDVFLVLLGISAFVFCIAFTVKFLLTSSGKKVKGDLPEKEINIDQNGDDVDYSIQAMYREFGSHETIGRKLEIISESFKIIESTANFETLLIRIAVAGEMLGSIREDIITYYGPGDFAEGWINLIDSEQLKVHENLEANLEVYCNQFYEDEYLKKKNGDYKKDIAQKIKKKIDKVKEDCRRDSVALSRLEEFISKIPV